MSESRTTVSSSSFFKQTKHGFVSKFTNVNDSKVYAQSTVFKRHWSFTPPNHRWRNGCDERVDNLDPPSFTDQTLVVSCDCHTYEVSEGHARMITACYGRYIPYRHRNMMKKKMPFSALERFAASMKDVFENADVSRLLLGETPPDPDPFAAVNDLLHGKLGYVEGEFESRGWWVRRIVRMRIPIRKFPVIFLSPTPEELKN